MKAMNMREKEREEREERGWLIRLAWPLFGQRIMRGSC